MLINLATCMIQYYLLFSPFNLQPGFFTTFQNILYAYFFVYKYCDLLVPQANCNFYQILIIDICQPQSRYYSMCFQHVLNDLTVTGKYNQAHMHSSQLYRVLFVFQLYNVMQNVRYMQLYLWVGSNLNLHDCNNCYNLKKDTYINDKIAFLSIVYTMVV